MQIVVDGLLTRYELKGRGDKCWLIVHGWGGSLDEWREIADSEAMRHRVVLVDLPGFGGTERPREAWGVEEYAKWTENFINKIRAGNVTFVGHSFGGRIGIVMAGLKLIEKLVLIDAAGMELRGWKSKLFEVVAPWTRWMPDAWRRPFRAKDYQGSGKMQDIYKKVVSEDLRGRLNSVDVPTLIIWGEKDRVLSFEEAKMLREGIRGARLRIVWGAGHWPHLEKRKELKEILEEEA